MRLILAILSRLETGLSTLWRRKRGKLRPLRFVGFCSGVAGCGGADRGRLVSAAACPRGSWHRLSGKHGASCCLWQAVCADIGLGLQVPAGSTYLEGSGYRPQRRSHGLLRCTSVSVSVCVCVPGLVVGEEGSGGRAGPESRSAEGLTSPKRAFGSLAGRQAEGGRFLMRGREPWKMGDPHTLSSSPPGCHPRDIGTPTCCTSAFPLGQFQSSSLVAG